MVQDAQVVVPKLYCLWIHKEIFQLGERKQKYLLETHLELVKDLQLNLGDVQIPQSAEYRNDQSNALWQQQ